MASQWCYLVACREVELGGVCSSFLVIGLVILSSVLLFGWVFLLCSEELKAEKMIKGALVGAQVL